MIIRSATISDKATIISLMNEFDEYYFKNNIFSEQFKPFWEYKEKQTIFEQTVLEWLGSHYLLFVAEEKNEILGYICGHIKERSPRVLDKEGYIDDWFVTEQRRKNGIGMKLYEALLEEFRKNRCNRLGLLTNVRNKNTIEFYHKLGFIDESLTMVKKLE